MRTLHVAAQPFPSYQGTQALVHAMLCALCERGHDTHLLSYAHGAFQRATPYVHHRASSRGGDDSLRSGPSWAKPAMDAQLSVELDRLRRLLKPDLIVAHHVEAASVALGLGIRPLLFVAHTDMAHELPLYLPPSLPGGARLSRWVGAAGGLLDHVLCRAATHVWAVSPLLADALRRRSGAAVRVCPVPWQCRVAQHSRAQARRLLDLDPDHELALYAGNLDAYQGWPLALSALGRLASARPGLRWLVATQSDPRELLQRARAVGLADRLMLRTLSGEHTRELLHAAADVALIPRQAPGGLPIKLLDALSRGVPVVAPHVAAAGLPLSQVACLTGASPAALADGLAHTLDAVRGGSQDVHAGLDYIARHHAPSRFAAAIEALHP